MKSDLPPAVPAAIPTGGPVAGPDRGGSGGTPSSESWSTSAGGSGRALRGLGVSPGIAIGPAHVVESGAVAIPEYVIEPDAVEAEVARFNEAATKARRQIKKLKSKALVLPDSASEEIGFLLDGIPMGFAFRPFYAWYGDMDLAPHLWQAFRLGGMTVEVEFHPPVTIDGFSSRKALAEHCQRVIADGVARAISGRPDGPPPAKHAAGPVAAEAATSAATSTAVSAPPVADPAAGSA